MDIEGGKCCFPASTSKPQRFENACGASSSSPQLTFPNILILENATLNLTGLSYIKFLRIFLSFLLPLREVMRIYSENNFMPPTDSKTPAAFPRYRR